MYGCGVCGYTFEYEHAQCPKCLTVLTIVELNSNGQTTLRNAKDQIEITATEIRLSQIEADKKLKKIIEPFWIRLHQQLMVPILNRTFLIFCRCEGLCHRCCGVNTECKSCGGTSVHRDILRQTF